MYWVTLQCVRKSYLTALADTWRAVRSALYPENGWDENHVKTFRRHIVNLGKTGLIFIYDELVADEPVNWNYLLHTTANPMTVNKSDNRFVHIQATNRGERQTLIFSQAEHCRRIPPVVSFIRQRTGCVPMIKAISRNIRIIGISPPRRKSRKYIALPLSSIHTR